MSTELRNLNPIQTRTQNYIKISIMLEKII